MSRPTPVSVDDLLKAQREAAAVKPKFLSKAERQRLAQEREEQEKQKKQEQATAQQRHKQKQLESPSQQSSASSQYSRHQRHSRNDFDSRASGSRDSSNGAPRINTSSSAPAQSAAISSNGPPQKKKRKTNDRKFKFDWDQDEDTSDRISLAVSKDVRPSHPISAAQQSADALLFSRDSGSKERSVLNELHWSEKKLEDMRERDWRIFREDFAIAARGGNIPRPLRSWRESSIPVPILRAIENIGYKDPSPIQRQAIPIGLQNRDLIGIAETGSGKTASFVIPMLAYISDLPPLSEENRHLGPYALILAPTRELAQQIEGETRKFASELNLSCVSIVGGRDMQEQAFNLRNGTEIIIATPGRLKDCIERHIIVLSQCTYVVMDEADRMVNEGWEEQLNFILDSLPVSNLKPDTEDAEDPLKLLRKEGEAKQQRYRVTMLYSATMPPSVERIARTYLRRPATITIGEANQAVGTVEQKVEFVGGEDKRKSRLLSILSSGFQPPIIVFVNQKKTADLIGKYIQNSGWSTSILHSGKTQAQREYALEELRNGSAPILVATDLAGRGIDVPNVSLVINFQMANHIEAYVHRIGRTGRAGNKGVAITFLDNGDEEVMYDLKAEIAKSPVSKVPAELARHPAAQSKMTRAMRQKRDADQG